MAELLVRFGSADAALLTRLLERTDSYGTAVQPSRVVLDAHVAAAKPGTAGSARQAGIPLLVDPQTHYLQGQQHPGDAWSRLPFATSGRLSPADFSSGRDRRALVSSCIEFQLKLGASVIIAPYVHLERPDDDWLNVQIALWADTRAYLDAHDIHLPVVAVVGLGWRLLDPAAWARGLQRLADPLTHLSPTEIALAASKVDTGAHPKDRLASFVSTIRSLQQIAPVIAWQQGTLGDVAVAAGAIGYETGLGHRERCDLRTAMGQHRNPPPADAKFGARPVYIPALMRSIPKRSLEALLRTNLGPRLLCLDYGCCPNGRESLLGDARAHDLRSRAQRLTALDGISNEPWKWSLLAEAAADGLDLAERVNLLARSGRIPEIRVVDTAALSAVLSVATEQRRRRLRRRAA